MTASAEKIGPLVDYLKQVRTDLKLSDVIELAERMAQTLDDTMARSDALMASEFRAIAAEIASLKRDITELRPDQLRFEKIPQAGRELDAVVEATEEASQTIMEAAEAIMGADGSDPDAYRALVDEKMIVIFEACSFQDITGQRIRKVVKTLNWIEERVGQFTERLAIAIGGPEAEETEDERRMRELILHGPQMKGEGISQDAVDDFFAQSDQADIDALFA